MHLPFCIKCGHEIPAEAAFCPNCGAPVRKKKEGEDIKALIKALGDKEFEVSMAAAVALGKMGPRAVEPLIKTLRDKELDLEVRKKAAFALGEIDDPRAVEPLKKAMSPDEHLGLYREAKQALEKIQKRRPS
ncbi:hypothetical protein ES702_03567 [subsurface metagenome]